MTTSISLPRKYLIGRTETVHEYLKALRSESGYIGLIHGDSGVGKTELSVEIERQLTLNHNLECSALRFEIQEANTAEEPFIKLYEAIYRDVKPSTLKQIRAHININPLIKVAKILTSVFRDVADSHAGGLKNTSNTIADIVTESTEAISTQKLKSIVGDSNYSTLITALNGAASRTNKKYILILDGLEQASERSITFIDSFINRLHKNIRILMLINSEDEAYTRKDVRNLKKTLQRHHLCNIKELQGLTPENIIKWKKELTGIDISLETAQKLHRLSHGRPLLLQACIESSDAELANEPNPSILYGYYDNNFNNLEGEVKNITNLLSVAFPHIISIEILTKASGLSKSRLYSAINDLKESRFATDSPNGYQCKHKLIADFLIKKMGEAALNDIKNQLLDATDNTLNQPNMNSNDSFKAHLITSQSGQAGVEFLLSYTKELLQNGSYQKANAKIDTINSLLKDGVAINDMQRTEYFLLHADLLGQYGEYEESLTCLDNTDHLHTSYQQLATILLSKAEKQFRLNRYQSAIHCASKARKIAAKHGDEKTFVKAIIRLAGISMDTNKQGISNLIKNILIDKVMPSIDSDSIKSHILRISARIEAPSDSRKAITLANSALKLAESTKSERDIGNCIFAIGESLRHANQTLESINAYNESLLIAKDTGNKDLEIYSLLGLVILALSDENLEMFNENLSLLQEAIDYNAPVEKLNLELFIYFSQRLSNIPFDLHMLDTLRTNFLKYRRYWQVQAIDKTNDLNSITINQLSEILKTLSITL